ncbi:TonB-dependent receptor domain-containing protein [Allosphingosinicella vermicomposti]|uniref:TonB-dependent receptor domain-containing protein n=1 Tax=Allosphingosinicella vermicomposti TaxID=614671 RepID=UPI000D1092CF|nr:TonB-dependent receptor [Allosphingosinicella vermicomposti]
MAYGLFGPASLAFAQEAEVQPSVEEPALVESAADAEQGEEPAQSEIIVTGSRILSPNVASVAPVQAISSEQITEAGVTNIQELLVENPAFGTPGLTRTNSAFLTSGTGAATINLRNLGANRTLVLANGRRIVAGIPGTSTVDLNVIPAQFIERVDILSGGASSLYGSDAVAGVVNFIYREDFEGVEAEGQYGITARGDAPRYQASLTAGGNLADDRGNVMLHIGYSNEGQLLSRQRSNTVLDDLDTFINVTGDPDDYGVPYEPFYSSFNLAGRFDVRGTAATGDDLMVDPTTGAVRNYTSKDGFNRQFYRTIAVPVERYLIAARGHYDLNDSVRLVTEATYSKTKSARQIEPFALDVANIYPATGRAPIETLVNGVAVLNPIVPTAIAAAAIDTDGDGLRDIGFARRLGEVGSRSGSTTRDLFRFVVGLDGSFMDDRFHWDVNYVYGATNESQQSTGQVNVVNFRNALEAIPDVDDLNNNGSTTDVVCADAQARDQGCVPIDIFGIGSITPDALAWINADSQFLTKITQQVVSANLSGSLVDLPAGSVDVAVGAEYRKETSSADWDALTNAGLNAGNAAPDTAGEFDVKEIYAEIAVPILSDTPFFHKLGVRASGRVSDYSSVGTVYSYSFGADWAPIEDVRFRASYARAVRAPNIGELYTGPSQTFPSGLEDPCEGIGATGGGATGDRCRADAGVAANIAENGVFTLTQSDRQGVSGFNSGNPDLNEETSDSYTVGVVINPTSIGALRNLVLSVDYFNIAVEDAIVAPPRQFILNQCYQQGDDQFCDLIERRQVLSGSNSAGSLQYIDAPLFNGGKLDIEGIDAVLSYQFRLEDITSGRFNARIAYTHLFGGDVIPIPGAAPDPYVGEIGGAKDRFTASLGYREDSWRVNFTGTYIGSSYEDDQALAPDFEPDTIVIPSEFYLDMQAGWTPVDNYEFYFGVDNLLDNDAPNILSGSGFNVTGTDTAANVYDVFGRRFYAGAKLRF